MTSENFEKVLQALQERKPFRVFTVELTGAPGSRPCGGPVNAAIAAPWVGPAAAPCARERTPLSATITPSSCFNPIGASWAWAPPS